MRNGTAIHPQSWLHKQSMLASFPVGWRRLNDWTEQGLVRTVKLDDSKNGRRLYSAMDMERVLATLAAGRTPRKKGGGK